MAARLMMKFPNAVTCDEITKIKSKLPEEDFVEQPPVSLKGIADLGSIFSYSNVKYVVCVCARTRVCVCNVCIHVWCINVCINAQYTHSSTFDNIHLNYNW